MAEELTAETFYRAYLHIDQFEGRCSVDTWLCEIGKNAWLEQRRKDRRKAPEETIRESQEEPFWLQIEQHDSALQIHRMLHRLPEPYREVFSLKIFGELKFREIADIFGKSESWAKMTFYRAKSQLLALLEEEKK